MSGTTITRDEWLKALEDASIVHATDPDAITVQDFVAMFDPPLKNQTGRRHLDQLVTLGRARRVWKVYVDKTGRRRTCAAYTLIRPDGKATQPTTR